MRKGFALGAGLVAAAALAAPAAAKELSVSLASGPTVSRPGDPWNAQLLVHGEPALLKQAAPSITIEDASGRTTTFAAKATGKRAVDGQLIYVTRVVFPTEGTWIYTLSDGLTDRAYEGGSVQIGTPTAAPAPPVSDRDSAPAFPIWPLVLGLALVFAGAGATFIVRRHRLTPPRPHEAG
jgi:hypothetical protein